MGLLGAVLVRKLGALLLASAVLSLVGCSGNGGNQEGTTVNAADLNKASSNMMQKNGKKGPGVPADHVGGPAGGPGAGPGQGQPR